MKIIEYCTKCLGNLSKIKHSYYIFYTAFVDDHLSGKVIEFNPACCLRNYSETMLSELEKKGYIVSTETDQNKIRIKPLGINEIVLSSKMTEMKHEMIMVCLDMDAHQHSYELDENVLEE